MQSDQRRSLPAVGQLLEEPALRAAIERWGRMLVTDLLREAIDEVRQGAPAGDWAEIVEARAAKLLRPSPRAVINATGVVAHTNLGRSTLSAKAASRVAEAATSYLDLEYDLGKGARGDRMAHLAPLLARLFRGHAALAVNNNAGAILLALRALAKGREVVISRGELVEIGGSFRIPDILAASAAKLVEVGTTNRTRLEDYERAVGPRTGALLKVHTSNFAVVGFTEETSVEDLSGLARARGIPLLIDWGSGDLVDLVASGIRDEIPVGDLLRRGADLVTFSGDKLLGGPQAGLIVGREELVKRLRKDPFARILRLDRLQIAALHATLSSYATGRAFEEIPTLRMLSLSAEEIGARAEAVAHEAARLAPDLRWRIEDGVSRPGGGSSPVGAIPTKLLAIEAARGGTGKLERQLRRGDPPVVARIHDDVVLLDLRTVLPDQDAALARAIAAATR
ncbi:MAG TPA: L-seryl-tRNA(Sec) selenium transferase [Candidatus Polarisedimenticolaceae bacterium]|nr:L-seryl-tRNA(Sec) selenium transferase [Candidatus Polarisedimenticolaceae bacterium]